MNQTTQYTSLREKIAAEKAARHERYAQFASLWERAHEAGMAAANACAPTPMLVGHETSLFSGKIDKSKPIYHVPDGVCGFAWVVVRPGNCAFAIWAKKHHDARSEYGGGMCVKWVHEFNQSMERKSAYARAFAKTLNDAGIRAYSNSRMD